MMYLSAIWSGDGRRQSKKGVRWNRQERGGRQGNQQRKDILTRWVRSGRASRREVKQTGLDGISRTGETESRRGGQAQKSRRGGKSLQKREGGEAAHKVISLGGGGRAEGWSSPKSSHPHPSLLWPRVWMASHCLKNRRSALPPFIATVRPHGVLPPPVWVTGSVECTVKVL